MQLGYIKSPERGETDRVLSAFAEHCLARNIAVAGVVQTNTECYDSALCDMDVRVLPDGDTFRISQSLGKNARGCRLNPEALETAVAHAQNALSDDTQLLIINKFGKHEADGRGFRDLIAEALSRDIPVLTAVNGLNEARFVDFSGNTAQHLDCSTDALMAWFDAL